MTLEETAALVQSAIIAIQQGKFEEAIPFLEKAVLEAPHRADVHFHLGNTLAAVGKTRSAIFHLQNALDLDEYYAEAHNNLGRLLHKQGCFDDAYRHYQAAIHIRKHYCEAELNLGLLWITQGKYELAKQQFKSILKWNKDLPIVYEQLAQLALQEKDILQAKHYYQHLLAFPIDSSDTWNNIGAVFSQIGDYDQAIYAFTKALELNPRHIHARNNRAAIYLQQHRLKEAIWEYTLYLRLESTDATGHYNIGVAWMLSGRLEEAVRAFQEAVRLYPHYTEAWCNLGILYIQQADLPSAYAAYQQVLVIEQNHETAQFMVSALLQSEVLSKNRDSNNAVIPPTAPLGYVKKLFNYYANHFEQHLIKALNYQVPQQLYHFMRPYLEGKRFNTLDLGCGTGLVGMSFQPVVDKLIGVDISSEMLKEAYKKSIYHQLVEQDILSFLMQSDQSYELILCVDTFGYFGELIEIMKGIFRMARPQAYFGFSIELFLNAIEIAAVTTQERYYHLQPTGRYQHELVRIRRLVEHCGWQWVDSVSIPGRLQQTQPVNVGLCIVQKPSP